MRRRWFWAVIVSCTAPLVVGVWLLRPLPPAHCDSRPDDPSGYLVTICQYILDHAIAVDPADPNQYRIKRMEERSDGGRTEVWVFLNCCYLGDIAIIDKETGAVTSFRPGAQ